MNQQIKERWVTALRSRSYIQGRAALRFKRDDEKYEFCCLGVLCDLCIKENPTSAAWGATIVPEGGAVAFQTFDSTSPGHWSDTGWLPAIVSNWAGLEGERDPRVLEIDADRFKNLSTLNDAGTSFDDIANLIEAQL